VGDGVQRGEAINKVCQIGECKSDMQINLELGRRLAPEAWPWESVEEMYDFILKDTGMTFEELQVNSPAYLPFEYYKYEKGLLRSDGQPGFETASGRIELWSGMYAQMGLDPLPYFEEPIPGPTSTPELYEEYPLVLTTGARNIGMFHSEHRQIKTLRALRPDPLIEMNPATAEKLGLSAGEWVWVENDRGRAKRKLTLTPALDPRVCSTDHAWWYPEAPAEAKDGLFGLWDLNINQLLTYQPGKSGLGSNYKTLLCKVYKA
jgi:anaerobic selenocysteine-containing dehydrogenase